MLSLYYLLVYTLVAGITCVFICKAACIANNHKVRVTMNALPMCINNTSPVKQILFTGLFEGCRAVLSQ